MLHDDSGELIFAHHVLGIIPGQDLLPEVQSETLKLDARIRHHFLDSRVRTDERVSPLPHTPPTEAGHHRSSHWSPDLASVAAAGTCSPGGNQRGGAGR